MNNGCMNETNGSSEHYKLLMDPSYKPSQDPHERAAYEGKRRLQAMWATL